MTTMPIHSYQYIKAFKLSIFEPVTGNTYIDAFIIDESLGFKRLALKIQQFSHVQSQEYSHNKNSKYCCCCVFAVNSITRGIFYVSLKQAFPIKEYKFLGQTIEWTKDDIDWMTVLLTKVKV